MSSICGMDCCLECNRKDECGGCAKTDGQSIKFLEDNNVYWGSQIEIPGSVRCYGIVADDRYLLVCEYGCGGADPQIILYKKR